MYTSILYRDKGMSFKLFLVESDDSNHLLTIEDNEDVCMIIYRSGFSGRILFFIYPEYDHSELLHSIGLYIFELDLFWLNLPEPYRNFPKKLLSRARKHLVDYIIDNSSEV